MSMGILDFGKKRILYYPGCLTKGVLKKEFMNYAEIFKKLKIDFVLLSDEEVCCGLPVINAGYRREARNLAQKNLDLFRKYNIKKIITSCPACYNSFKDDYPRLLKNWDIEVEHATVSILSALKKIKLRPNYNKEIVTYHDPCHLVRHGGIYNSPREVIQMLGGEIIEMKHNKKYALCCGAGGGVKANFPELAIRSARLRVKEAPENAEKIITPCGLCYSNLKFVTGKSEEFSDFVLRKLEEIGL